MRLDGDKLRAKRGEIIDTEGAAPPLLRIER